MRHFIYTKLTSPSSNVQNRITIYEIKSKAEVVHIAADMLQSYRSTEQAVEEIIVASVPSLRKVPKGYTPKPNESVSADRTRLHYTSGFSCTWVHELVRQGVVKLTEV